MHPILLRIALSGRVLEVHSFGVMVALGCVLGTLLAMREARARGGDPAVIRDLCLWGLALSLLGARLLDVATSGRRGWDDCLDAAATSGVGAALSACTRSLLPWEGGLAFYGGVVTGVATAALFARRHGLPLAATLDLLTPSLPLGHALGRVGCLLAGCCFGQPTSLPWGIAFFDGSVAYRELQGAGGLGVEAAATPPLHPTQVYEAIGELVLFVLLMRRRRRTRFAGELALLWVCGYAALRFAVELVRGDTSRGFWVALATPALDRLLGLPPSTTTLLSTSQGIAAVLLCGALALLLIGWRRATAAASRSATTVLPAASR
jgi:phosphatidylglycerol:prolipoprotein diacylglycerol transferase